MRKIISLLMMLIFPFFFASCEDEEQMQNVIGDWYTSYSATGVTSDGIAYNRVVQVYHFNPDGTGYWCYFYLTDDLDEPVGMKGGHNIGSFTYTMSESNIRILLNVDNEVSNPTWGLAYLQNAILGTDGSTAYTLLPATAEQMEWCRYWDEICNGGGEIDAINMTMENFKMNGAEQTGENKVSRWTLAYQLTVGNNNSEATIYKVPVFALGDYANLLNRYVNTFANNKPFWATSGMELVEYGSATSGTYRFPNSYSCLMSASGNQGIVLPTVAYTPTKGNDLHFRQVGAGVNVKITNSTNNTLAIDAIIVKSENYRITSDAVTLQYDVEDLNYTPTTTSDASEREVKVVFPATGIGVFELPANAPSANIVVPILPIGDDNLTIEIRCHVQSEGVLAAAGKIEYSHTSEFNALGRGELGSVEAKLTPESKDLSSTGAFSIGGGKKVYFSKGNLKASTTSYSETYGWVWGNWTFSFMNKQYDMLEDGDKNNRPSLNYSDRNEISLFGFGTSGYPNGQECYTPNSADQRGWMNIWDDTYYFQTHLVGTADWGYNAISNGGKKENSGWRTLTADEWEHLLFYREGNEDKLSLATVCGVKGAVILPDVWQLPDGLTWEPGSEHYATNVYSATQWDAMEAAGAVFLPAAGVRRMENYNPTPTGIRVIIEEWQETGWYWTSSVSAMPEYAHVVGFHDGEGIALSMEEREFGSSVRLVRDF